MRELYVSPDGNDRRDGSRRRPFGTLTRALDAARKSRTRAAKRIVLRGGKYYDVSLTLGPQDSGLTIEAAPGEKPVLCGGRLVGGWRRSGEHFYAARLPGVKEGQWDFRMLVVNGHWRPRARLPREGRFEHLSKFDVRWMSTTYGGWERKPTEQELTTMIYRPGDLGPWLDVRNAELTVYHMWDESLVGVKSLDDDSHTVTFSTPATHPPGGFGGWGGGKTYVVWNVREGMQEPGQWYLDRTAGKLVYWPLPGEDMGALEVIAPTAECVIRIAGEEGKPVSGVTLKGLTISATTVPAATGGFGAGTPEGAVSCVHTSDCRMLDLTVCNVAGQGLKLQKCPGVRVEDCVIHDTGACGIRVDGQGAEVTRCRVHHVGVILPSAIGVLAGGGGVCLRRSQVYHTPYSAVCASGGSGSRFEENLFHHVMEVLHDGAAIYVTFCKDYVIRGNMTRDVLSTGAAHAYYLDEQSENCVVEDNVAVNCHWPSHNHMARRNVIRGNVFVHGGDMRITFPKCEDFTFEGNVLRAGGAIRIHQFDAITSMRNNVLFSDAGKVEVERGTGYGGGAVEPFVPRDGTVVGGGG